MELLRDKFAEFELSFDDINDFTKDGAELMVCFGESIPMVHQLWYNHAIHLWVLDLKYKWIDAEPEISPELESLDAISDEEIKEAGGCDSGDNNSEDSDNNDVIDGKLLPNLRVDLPNLLERI